MKMGTLHAYKCKSINEIVGRTFKGNASFQSGFIHYYKLFTNVSENHLGRM